MGCRRRGCQNEAKKEVWIGENMVEHKFIFTYKDIAEASGNMYSAIPVAVTQKRLNPNDLKSIADYINYKTLTELEEMKRLTRFWKAKFETVKQDYLNAEAAEERG